jgi:hypothetical protein
MAKRGLSVLRVIIRLQLPTIFDDFLNGNDQSETTTAFLIKKNSMPGGDVRAYRDLTASDILWISQGDSRVFQFSICILKHFT